MENVGGARFVALAAMSQRRQRNGVFERACSRRCLFEWHANTVARTTGWRNQRRRLASRRASLYDGRVRREVPRATPPTRNRRLGQSSSHLSIAPAVAAWLRQVVGGVEVDVVVSPRASRSKVVGLHDGRLKLQLAAPPVDGAANAELIELVSSVLGVPRRDVTMVRGETSRRKTVCIAGVSIPNATAALLGEAP